jgi:hypothetical protein
MLWNLQMIFKTKTGYKAHMRRHVQGGSMEPFRGKSRMDINVIPHVDDLNNYCKSCKLFYKSKGDYKAHPRYMHNMIIESKGEPGLIQTLIQM